MFLRQPPHERVGRGEAHRAVEWFEVTGKDAQERALACAVGADDPDDVAGRHGHVEPFEQGAMGESARHVLRDEGCGHEAMVSPPRCGADVPPPVIGTYAVGPLAFLG